MDSGNRNGTAVYSECRSSTTPVFYSYAACARQTRIDAAAINVDCPLHKHTAHSAYATVAEGKTESENTYSPVSQCRAVFRNPAAQLISNNSEKEKHMYYSEPETNTIPKPLQMTIFYDETQTTSPTVSTAFQLGARYSSHTNNTFSLKSLPIEEQLYNSSKRTDF